MKLYYTDPTTGNKVVVGLAPQSSLTLSHPELAFMDSGEFTDWAISRVDPLGTLSITILNDSDPIPQSHEEAFQSLVAQFDEAVEAHLHTEAVAHGYTNIERACMYSSYPNPYWEESQSFVAWVGAVWSYCFEQMGLVQEGLRGMPTIPQIIAELPTRAGT